MSIYAIADNIRKIRTEKFQESQEKFAERLNIRLRTVQKIENGYCLPKLSTLIKIAQVSGLTIDELLI